MALSIGTNNNQYKSIGNIEDASSPLYMTSARNQAKDDYLSNEFGVKSFTELDLFGSGSQDPSNQSRDKRSQFIMNAENILKFDK